MAKLSGKSGSIVLGTGSVAGINRWELESIYDVLNQSGFDTGGHNDYGLGVDTWKGNFSGYKDGASLSLGSLGIITLKEAQDGSARVFQGTAILLSGRFEVARETVVQYAYQFLGSGALKQGSDFYYASDSLLSSSDTMVETGETTYTKVKELTIPGIGQFRIKFRLACPNVGGVVYAKIYRNGIAVGTERMVTGAAYDDFSEDLSGWAENDLCQIYARSAIGLPAQVSNFRIYGTKY